MQLDRRSLLAAGGACLASCAAGGRAGAAARTHALDAVLAANAAVLPERAGAGANHYPMAAEVLEALGREDAIEDDWRTGAAGYGGAPPRVAPIPAAPDDARALGDHRRYGDWLDHFRAELARERWQAVVARWAPRLAPGIAAATFHGLIRTAHAVRALERADTAPRRDELAVGLAYWAARYVELPATHARAQTDLRATLVGVERPWLADATDVDFSDVMERLVATPLAPPAALGTGADPWAALDELVHEAAAALLEMLVAERQRIWLLHGVTGPAAVGMLLPCVDAAGADRLVAHARQAVVALHAAYGQPYVPRASVRADPPAWDALLERAVASRSVHTLKLLEALARFDRDDADPLFRSVAAQWLEWT